MLKVSIIIPVYNVAQYIQRCIHSILVQERTCCDIECIIVNDCTQDDSMQIIHDMLNDYHGNIQFVICHHKVNKGLSAARNTGIRRATGDYILFVDSDDYISDDCLKQMQKGVDDYPGIDVILGNAYSCKYGQPFFPSVSEPMLLSNANEILLKIYFAELHFHAWNRLIRRNLLLDNDLFFVEGLLYEDMPWTYRLISVMSSMLVLPYNTYIYEDNVNSITNTPKNRMNQLVFSFCYIINFILDNIRKEIRSDSRIYCFAILLRTIDMNCQFSCSKDMIVKLDLVKYRLIREALLSGRLLLSLFFMTSLKPFVSMYQYPFIRRNYHKVTVLLARTERFIDRVF